MRRRRVVLVVAALLCRSAAPAVAAESFGGFTHCPPPARPACVETARAEPEIAACEEDMRIYTATVFKYRECLEREMERAIRDANAAIDAWRCRADPTKCRN